MTFPGLEWGWGNEVRKPTYWNTGSSQGEGVIEDHGEETDLLGEAVGGSVPGTESKGAASLQRGQKKVPKGFWPCWHREAFGSQVVPRK